MTTPHLRKSIGRSPLRRAFLLIAVALACFALWTAPKAFGVTPTPDGCYEGGNTAEGSLALDRNTDGSGNTAIGHNCSFFNTTGRENTAIGHNALYQNTGG